MPQTAFCPYCHKALPTTPKRKVSCPFCHLSIYVREGRPCTQDEARAEDWLKKLAVTREAFNAARGSFTNEIGHVPKATDVVWQLMNGLVRGTRDHHQLKMIYFQMALFLKEEGKDFLATMQEAIRAELAGWQNAAETGSIDWRKTRLRVTTCGTASCNACGKLEGATFTYSEALNQMPIPVRDCTHDISDGSHRGWCRCCYRLVFNA